MSLNGPPSGCATCVRSCEAARVTIGWGLSLPLRPIFKGRKMCPVRGQPDDSGLFHHVNDGNPGSML